MRLKSLRLKTFGPFSDQEIELAPVTVLFGANGAGKSTILDAIEDALTLSVDGVDAEEAHSQSDEDEGMNLDLIGRSNFSSAVVYAELDEWAVPGSSDELIMRRVLWKSLEEIEEIVEGDLGLMDPYDDCPSLSELMSQTISKLVESGTMGTPEARISVATHLLQHSVLAFEGRHWGLVSRAPLVETDTRVDEFETRILDLLDPTEDQFDELLWAIYDLENGEDAKLTTETSKPDLELSYWRRDPTDVRPTLYSRIRPVPMRLEFEPSTLDLELEAFVDQIASRLTLRSPQSNHVSWLTPYRVPGPTKSPAGEYLMDPSEDNSTHASKSSHHVDDFNDDTKYQPDAQKFVISSLVRNAVERITTHANSIVPKFLLQDSQIDIEIISPTRWKPNAPRLRATMNENGRKFPLAYVGSGIARWASYAIRLACQELVNGTIVNDPNTGVPQQVVDTDVPPAFFEVLLENAFIYKDNPTLTYFDGATPYEEVAALKILPAKLGVVLLLDEPEAHLHPRAVASIGEWLMEISPRVASVVVATHHPSLFNLRGIGVQKHVVLRNQQTSVSEPWNPASEELVTNLAHQIGLTAGDLFMMSRFVLFVEGPHDLAILEEFFGDLLKQSMVRLVPLHGAHDIGQLATSEIVWCMGIPIGVLTDGTNIERVMRGERANYIEKLVDRMLRECKAENREVAPFGLEKDDVLLYLDDEITATFASEVFPGWSTAKTIWNQIDQPAGDTANGAKFKKWITKTYGLPLDRDNVRDIAKKCKEAGIIPEELCAIVSGIAAKTI